MEKLDPVLNELGFQCQIAIRYVQSSSLNKVLKFPSAELKLSQNLPLMSGSCHLDRASKLVLNVTYLLLLSFFNCGRVLQFGTHSRYYKGALTQKRSFLVVCTTFRSDFHVG